MCNKVLVVDERGPSWVETATFEGSLGSAQNNIGEYVRHIEDTADMAKKTPPIYGRYLEMLEQIDLALIKIDVESKNDKGTIMHDWLNHIWTLKPAEQRILLKKIGIVVK